MGYFKCYTVYWSINSTHRRLSPRQYYLSYEGLLHMTLFFIEIYDSRSITQIYQSSIDILSTL